MVTAIRERNEATDDDDATVTILDVLPAIEVIKQRQSDFAAGAGGTVEFAVTVTNIGNVSLTLTDLTDSVYGNLFDASNPNVTNNSCGDLSGEVLAPDASDSCTFEGQVTGLADDPPHVDVVTVTGEDDDGNEVTDDDDATVTLVPPGSTAALGDYVLIAPPRRHPGNGRIARCRCRGAAVPGCDPSRHDDDRHRRTLSLLRLRPAATQSSSCGPTATSSRLPTRAASHPLTAIRRPRRCASMRPQPGAPLPRAPTHTIAYSNSGSLAAAGVTLDATVPQTTTFNPASNPGWSCEGGAVTPGTLCTFSPRMRRGRRAAFSS